MRTYFSIVLLATTVSTSFCEPTQIFGGEFAVGDGLDGFTLDINADGIFDINFAYYGITVNSIFGWDGFIQRASATSDMIFASSNDENNREVHDRFAAGDLIGPAQVDGIGFSAIAYENFFEGNSGGPWLDQEPGYIGFSFLIDGVRHYGWAEVEMDNTKNTDEGFLVLYGVGYETTPETPIAAGAPLGCAADFTGDGVLDIFDVFAFLDAYAAMDPAADFTGEGTFDIFDVFGFLDVFNAGCV